jgi:peptidyl-prolyl cis-trans isomerase D
MLSSIRAFTKSWVAIVIFMLLLVSLIVWGGSGKSLGTQFSTGVITVGSHQLSGPEFEEQFNRALERIGQQNNGPPPSREEAIKAGFHTRMLHELASQMAFAEAVNKLGLVPSPKQFAEKLQTVPNFFNEVTGEFDKKKYLSVLQQNKISEKSFEQITRDEIAFDHLTTGMQAGLVAPRIYGVLVAASQLENRTFSAFTIDASKVAKPVPPTDAQLEAFIKEFGQKRPETRELSFVRFSTKAIQDSMTVDPAELQKLYNFKKDTLSKPELRSLVQIPVKNAGQATQVAQRLRGGEDPAAIAKSVGVEAVTYTDQPKTAITDRKVADAAFALPAGQVSAAIQGELGMSVVKVNDVKPALTVPFEQAKPDLEKQLKHDAAQKKVYDQVEAYEKAHEGGANMTESAKKVGATVDASGEIAQNGATPKGQPPAGVSPKMLAKAFTMAQGEESDTEDEGNGEYYVVRVDKITPSALPKLADVREQATKGYMQRQLVEALKAKGEELSARVRKGESLEAVAASIGAKVEHTVGLEKAQAQQQAQAIGMQVLQAVFGGAKGDVLVAPKSNDTLSVVKIDDVQTAPIEQLAPLADASRRQANGALINDMVQNAQAQASAALKPKIDAARAAQTLGITADQVETDTKPKLVKKGKG